MKLKQVHIKQQIRRKLLARPDFFCPNKKKKGDWGCRTTATTSAHRTQIGLGETRYNWVKLPVSTPPLARSLSALGFYKSEFGWFRTAFPPPIRIPIERFYRVLPSCTVLSNHISSPLPRKTLASVCYTFLCQLFHQYRLRKSVILFLLKSTFAIEIFYLSRFDFKSNPARCDDKVSAFSRETLRWPCFSLSVKSELPSTIRL